MVGGALLLYFTNSLYEPPLNKFQQPPKLDDAASVEAQAASSESETQQKLPLLRPLCAPSSDAENRAAAAPAF